MTRKREDSLPMQRAEPLEKCADPFRLHPTDDPYWDLQDAAAWALSGLPEWQRKFQPRRKR
jgi:hypothetical protein